MDTLSRRLHDNLLLLKLPRADFKLILPFLTIANHAAGAIMLAEGDDSGQVSFPHGGMVSLLTIMNGKSLESSAVGREGVIGAMAGQRSGNGNLRAVAQVALTASHLTSRDFRRLSAQSDALWSLCVRFNDALLTQTRILAFCNALHPSEARVCRWLLRNSGKSNSDLIDRTHDEIAMLLGIRRPSVTIAARKLQDAGIISYSRGSIRILKRRALRELSCECHQAQLDHAFEP